MNRHAAFLVAMAVLALVVLTSPLTIPVITDVVERGAKLSDSTNVDGVIAEGPEVLATMMSAVAGREVSVDACSLARMVRSEQGRSGQITKVLCCHVVANQAAAEGRSITAICLLHSDPRRSGHYGEQITGRVATDEDPYESDLAAAEHALAERAEGIDRTAGATNFVNRGAFGVQPGTTSFEELRARWAARGKVPGKIPGADVGMVFFWDGSVPEGMEAL